MNSVKTISFAQSHNASFLSFLSKFFASEGAEYVRDPLPYSGPNPDSEGEETSIVNMDIAAEDWQSFLPEVPGELIYNILYGQKYSEGKKKILTFKGLSNGLETQLVFRKNGKSWRLVKVNAY